MSLLIICKEELADSANHMARAVGNQGDEFTFGVRHSKKDGLLSFTKYYRVCNFGVVPVKLGSWMVDPRIPEELPEGVSRSKCQEALDAIGTDIVFIPHAGDAPKKLADLGYKVVEVRE